jgi:hypothetical protein
MNYENARPFLTDSVSATKQHLATHMKATEGAVAEFTLNEMSHIG